MTLPVTQKYISARLQDTAETAESRECNKAQQKQVG